jgi:hypothetical protein
MPPLRALAAVVVAWACGGACGAGAGATVHDTREALAQVGKTVSFTGVAENAKAAAIVLGTDLAIYCLDQSEWPIDLRGARVTVTGKLEHSDELAARTGPSGDIGQGTEGKVFLLRSCQVSR